MVGDQEYKQTLVPKSPTLAPIPLSKRRMKLLIDSACIGIRRLLERIKPKTTAVASEQRETSA